MYWCLHTQLITACRSLMQQRCALFCKTVCICCREPPVAISHTGNYLFFRFCTQAFTGRRSEPGLTCDPWYLKSHTVMVFSRKGILRPGSSDSTRKVNSEAATFVKWRQTRAVHRCKRTSTGKTLLRQRSHYYQMRSLAESDHFFVPSLPRNIRSPFLVYLSAQFERYWSTSTSATALIAAELRLVNRGWSGRQVLTVDNPGDKKLHIINPCP